MVDIKSNIDELNELISVIEETSDILTIGLYAREIEGKTRSGVYQKINSGTFKLPVIRIGGVMFVISPKNNS